VRICAAVKWSAYDEWSWSVVAPVSGQSHEILADAPDFFFQCKMMGCWKQGVRATNNHVMIPKLLFSAGIIEQASEIELATHPHYISTQRAREMSIVTSTVLLNWQT